MTLPPDRAVHLAMEAGSASALLTEALALLAKHPGPDNADPFFECLSMGMEKTVKLTMGLDGLVRSNGWPPKRVMKTQYGHHIDSMDARLRGIIRQNASQNAPLVLAALDALGADPVIDQVVGAMSRYAVDGRFYNLDYLAEGPPKEASPRHLWIQLESELGTPEVVAETVSTDDIPSAWRRAAVAAVDRAVRLWVECYRVAWTQGVFGPLGRQMSNALVLS